MGPEGSNLLLLQTNNLLLLLGQEGGIILVPLLERGVVFVFILLGDVLPRDGGHRPWEGDGCLLGDLPREGLVS